MTFKHFFAALALVTLGITSQAHDMRTTPGRIDRPTAPVSLKSLYASGWLINNGDSREAYAGPYTADLQYAGIPWLSEIPYINPCVLPTDADPSAPEMPGKTVYTPTMNSNPDNPWEFGLFVEGKKPYAGAYVDYYAFNKFTYNVNVPNSFEAAMKSQADQTKKIANSVVISRSTEPIKTNQGWSLSPGAVMITSVTNTKSKQSTGIAFRAPSDGTYDIKIDISEIKHIMVNDTWFRVMAIDNINEIITEKGGFGGSFGMRYGEVKKYTGSVKLKKNGYIIFYTIAPAYTVVSPNITITKQ